MGACIEHKKGIISTKHFGKNAVLLNKETFTNQNEKNIHFKTEDFIKSSIFNTKNEFKNSQKKMIHNVVNNNNPVMEYKTCEMIALRVKMVK